MDAKTTAKTTYDKLQNVRQQYERMGMKPSPAMLATQEQIEQHIQNCQDAAAEYDLQYLDWEKIEFGSTREQIFAVAESKRKASNKRAGARALVSKYGKSAAQDIIYNKTGKRINLRG